MENRKPGCFCCEKGYPHSHYVYIPIRDAKTNQRQLLEVKEGSSFHKKLVEMIESSTLWLK